MQNCPQIWYFFWSYLTLIVDWYYKNVVVYFFWHCFFNIKSEYSNKFYNTLEKILLLHTCSHVINSSHLVLGKNGSSRVTKPRLKIRNFFIYDIALYTREGNIF